MSKTDSGKNQIETNRIFPENKSAEEALRQSENQLRLVTDAIPALIAYVDREHCYRFVNRKYFEWFGQEPSEIIGKHLSEVIGENAYNTILPYIKRVFAGEKFTYEQVVNYRSIGNRYVQIDFLPDFDTDEKTVIGYYALVQDIDERKRRESNLVLLADIAEDFSRLLTAEEIMQAVGAKIGKYLNVSSCLFVEINETDDSANVQSAWSANAELPEVKGVHKLSEFVTEDFQAAARRGETIAIGNTQNDERTDADAYSAFNIHSFVTVPFRRAGEWKYLISIHDTKPREWSKDELELIREVSSRTFPRIERAIAEAALRESEERMQLAMKIAEAATWEVDLVNNRTYWSESHFTMLGYKPTPNREASTEMWQNALSPEDLQKIVAEWRRAEREHDTFYSEHRIRRADNGKIVWVNAAGKFFYNAEDKAVRFVGIFYEITRRKRAEDLLRETNAILNAINLNTPTLIYVKDRESRILSANPATCKVIGKTLPEIIGKNHAEYMNDEAEGAMIHANDLRIIESGKTETFEEFVYQNDGNLHIFLSTKTPYRDESGEIVGLIGVSVDITERKRAEETLRESEERLRLATNAAEMFSWETDVAAQKIKWSENAAEIIGCAAEDLPDHTDDGQFFVLPEDKENLDLEFQNILVEGITNYIFEFRGNEPEADRKYWQAQGLIIYDKKKNPVRIVGVTQNITARKRAEQERERLLESEKIARHEAENANRLKDEFLATVSHELRTPLNAILGWSTIAGKNPADTETAARALEIIERSARQQNQIIADILDVSRIITGKLHLNVMPVNLIEIINSAIEIVRPTLDAKRIKLETVFDSKASVISGDANRFQQIMWNLLTNAAKFAETDGQISVSLRVNGAFAEVTVTDNGIGIEPEFLPFVFDRFRQADGGMNRKHGGLGLGLSIVRHLTEAHGGSVRVESEGKGKGASFSVLFPLNTFKQNDGNNELSHEIIAVKANEKAVPILENIRILLVDDEPDALDLAATILRTNGAIVITADSADNALRKLKHNIPDLIISDIGMPDKSGNDLIREIRALYGSKIPAIALTAYARPEDRRQFLEAGFDLHFPKPVEADLLVSMIKKLF